MSSNIECRNGDDVTTCIDFRQQYIEEQRRLEEEARLREEEEARRREAERLRLQEVSRGGARQRGSGCKR